MPNMKQNNKGLTLLELAFIIALVGIFILVIVPLGYRFFRKSADARNIENATQFKKAVNLTLIDMVMEDQKPAEGDTGFLSYSTQDPYPTGDDAQGRFLLHVLSLMNTSKVSFETKVFVTDNVVSQITYLDLKTNTVYVWYMDTPKGTELTAAPYSNTPNTWHVFYDQKGENWEAKYAE